MADVRRSCAAVRCVLVGDTSPADQAFERGLRALVSSLGLSEHVIFAGFQKDVTDFLLMSDIVVHSSILPEPFGRVVLEAMACRRPVIGSRAGGVPEIVRDGETGLLFPPGDATRLAEALVALINAPDEARRLGENGYQHLLHEFHVSRNVEATQRLYESLTAAGDSTVRMRPGLS